MATPCTPGGGTRLHTTTPGCAGEADASVVLQTSQAALVGGADPTAPWNNAYFGKNSKLGGWHFNLPIPFSSSGGQ